MKLHETLNDAVMLMYKELFQFVEWIESACGMVCCPMFGLGVNCMFFKNKKGP